MAARQADQVIFVASATSPAQLSAIERLLAQEPGFLMKRKHLVLSHPGQTAAPQGINRWHAGRELERIYPLRVGHAADFSHLARFLLGRAVGLVLGGGAARGLAHLGALKAFEHHAVPIDAIGGNSMGALIGAQYAMGLPVDEIRQNMHRLTRQGASFTVPSVSLLSGRRFEHSLQRLFGHTLVEDLWRPFFAAACNLSRAQTVALDRGALWRAVLASNSPAGLLPPVVHQGELLVDGAILDNVPVGEMRMRLGIPLERRRGNGSIIAIDVDAADPFCVPPDLHHLPRLRRPKFNGRKLPGIVDILYRAGHIGGLNTRERTAAMADFFLAPPLSQFPLLGYERAPEIIEAGYRHAMQEIDRWTNLPRH
jgi:NTE family protein/lysophospholipid hydrolase